MSLINKSDLSISDIDIEGKRYFFNLDPKQFKYKDSDKVHYGFVSDDIKSIDTNLIINYEDGSTDINYSNLIVILTGMVNSLQDQIYDIKNKLSHSY